MQQFFNIDGIVDEHKVNLASMYLYDKSLVWHHKFIKFNGEDGAWQVYEPKTEQRFGQSYEDPMGELKNLKSCFCAKLLRSI